MKQRFGVFATLVFAGVFVSLTAGPTTSFCHALTQSVPDLETHRNSPVLDTSGFTITIHVYNYAAVPEKALARAKDEAERIFRCAGSIALWVDHSVNDAGDRRDPQDSRDSWNNTHFVLRLLAQSRERLAKDAMGAALSFRIANVFMNRVTEQLKVGELSAGQVLGHAIVHEIGHHLLGDNSHAPHGIMVAKSSNQHLRRISKGDLLFTQQEVQRIQDEVKHRSHSVLRAAD